MVETLSITLDNNDYYDLLNDTETYSKSNTQLKTMNGLINQILINYFYIYPINLSDVCIKKSSHNSRNFKYRPSNEVKKYVESNSQIFNFDKYAFSTYIRYVLSCYCQLKTANRVNVLFKEIIEKIEIAINSKIKISIG